MKNLFNTIKLSLSLKPKDFTHGIHCEFSPTVAKSRWAFHVFRNARISIEQFGKPLRKLNPTVKRCDDQIETIDTKQSKRST